MKTIVRKESNISIWIFNNSQSVDVQENQTAVGEPVEFFISDCTTSDCDLIEGVTPPSDWDAHKYLYASGSWTLNPDWVNPNPPVEK